MAASSVLKVPLADVSLSELLFAILVERAEAFMQVAATDKPGIDWFIGGVGREDTRCHEDGLGRQGQFTRNHYGRDAYRGLAERVTCRLGQPRRAGWSGGEATGGLILNGLGTGHGSDQSWD
jgi:hypothetical protein